MRKLYLIIDDWANDQNFVGNELELIRKKYDVTVICDPVGSGPVPTVRYMSYTRPSLIYVPLFILKGIADKELWQELVRASKYRTKAGSGTTGRLLEVVRYYLAAEMFRLYMRKNDCFENGAIYYSYWNTCKCLAITQELEKYPDSRCISRIHGYDLYDERFKAGYQPFKVAMDGGLSKLIFIAHSGKEYYLERYGIKDSDKYPVCFLGTKRLQPGEMPEKIKDEYFTVVSCSRIIDLKRVDRIAEALSLIGNDIKIRWIHFGDGGHFNEVKEKASGLLDDKENIVYSFEGRVENRDILGFYEHNRVDAFITASSSEGNPVSVMEAMSFGIPAIAPAICDFPYMIRDCGILVSEECTAQELSEAIMSMYFMPEDQIKKLRENVYEHWDESFNAEKNNKRFVEEILDKL